MKICGKFAVDISGFAIKRNKSHDGREATVDLDVSVKREDASKLGEDFETLAFSTCRVMQADPEDEDGVDATAFLLDTIKPGKRVVFENHQVELEGEVFSGQPAVVGIKTIDGEARVVVRVRLPIDVDSKKLIAALIAKVGQTLQVNFNPVQPAFAFVRGAKKGEAQAEATH